MANKRIDQLNTQFTQNIGDGFNDYVYTLGLQSNNKIIVGGEFNNFKDISSRYIAKLKFDINPGSDIFDLTYDGNQYIISKR
jgi:hypothetical protein